MAHTAYQTEAYQRHWTAELPPNCQLMTLPGLFTMHRGGKLEQVQVAYETLGQLNEAGDNTVLLFTGLSPNTHVASSEADPEAGWWEFMVGPDKPIDTKRFFIICVNSLGSCFGSTGPSSINPETEQLYRLDFPELSVEDIAQAGHGLVEQLGIKKLNTVAGASLGGMSALAYAALYPDGVENLVSICAAAKASPFAIAVRSLQREIIRSDPVWDNGAYDINQEPVEGMRLARKLGLISYRSAEEWDHRFKRERVLDKPNKQSFDPEFQIESYLEANAQKFIGSFDANSYLYLSRAMDWFDVGQHGDSLEDAFNRLKLIHALVIGVETDILFPIQQQQEMATLLAQADIEVDYAALASIQGHDAFLVDEERFAPVVRKFFHKVATLAG